MNATVCPIMTKAVNTGSPDDFRLVKVHCLENECNWWDEKGETCVVYNWSLNLFNIAEVIRNK